MMPWFGDPWPREDFRADACRDDRDRVPTPVGDLCWLCETPILLGERGQLLAGIGASGEVVGPMPAHIECLCRNVTGCSDLYASGQPWTPGHVCTAGPYREDALRVWKLMHERPPFRLR